MEYRACEAARLGCAQCAPVVSIPPHHRTHATRQYPPSCPCLTLTATPYPEPYPLPRTLTLTMAVSTIVPMLYGYLCATVRSTRFNPNPNPNNPTRP